MRCITFEFYRRRSNRTMSKHILFILLAVCLLQTSCDIINPAEKIPTYIHIDSFKFVNPDPSVTGTGIQSINSAWVYVDGKTVGVFELPADIPVLLTGTQEIQIAPGVNNQGFSDYKIQYPFFEFYNQQVTEQAGKVITLAAETKYTADLKFWKADFESGNQFSKLNSTGDTLRRVNSADSVLEGGGAGCITLGAGGYGFAEVIAPFNIKPGSKCFLEISYKGNLSFTAGVLAFVNNTNDYSYLAGVNPKEDKWGKIYIDVLSFTTKYPTAGGWGVIIKSTLNEGQTEGYLLLDNIKVISY